jgi:hypothetical protein
VTHESRFRSLTAAPNVIRQLPDRGSGRVKDQYFGDVNDYLKYGILRELAKSAGTLHVVWRLTPSDGSTDGKFTRMR